MTCHLQEETPELAKEYQKMSVTGCHIMQGQSMSRVSTGLAGIGGTCPHRGNIGNQVACRRPQLNPAEPMFAEIQTGGPLRLGRDQHEKVTPL